MRNLALHLLYCDESNLEERSGDFFVYGGLVVHGDAVLSLTHSIDRIREDAGVPRDSVLKFNPAPRHLSHQDFKGLKQTVIETAAAHGCIFLTSMILHDIATNVDEARRNSINTICYHFDCYLNRPKDHGLVLIDRFEDREIDAHLREKFSVGLTRMPYSKHMRLERIVGYHYSAIGQSHLPSVIDIALGSFRYAINVHTRQEQEKLHSAGKLLSLLAPLFLRERDDGKVSELSLFFSPKVVHKDEFRLAYERLSAFLAAHGIVAEQPITAHRMY